MRFSRLFSEFLHDPRFSMEERRFNAAYALVMSNMANGVELKFDPKTLARILPMVKVEGEEGNMQLQAGQNIECTSNAEMQAALQGDAFQQDQSFINTVCIDGPMTREGDACTYGSKEHKCMMIEAANDPRCRGHILMINSGGGAVGTLLDYREAINYCLSRGQNVVAVVEECAASAACFTANMTNRIFATRESDEVGSLGMFAIFSTIADGTLIPDTQEVVHIRYAEQSTDKNLPFRKASEGDMSMIDQMLREDLDQILRDTRKDRPCLADDQLTGKMYKARDVMGSMVDEIGAVEDAANWLIADWNARNGAALPVKTEAENANDTEGAECNPKKKPCSEEEDTECNPKKKRCEDDPEDNDPEDGPENKDPEDDPEDKDPEDDPNNCPDEHNECNPKKKPCAANSSLLTPNSSLILTPNSQQNMYNNIASALGLEAIESTEEGVMLNASLADQMEAHLQGHADAIAALNQQIADLQAANAQQIADLNTAHEAAIADLNAAHAQQIADINTAHEDAIAGLTEAQQKAEESLTAANQRIADLSAEVENLNNAQQQQPQAGAQPASNGQQPAEAPKIATRFAYDPTLSAKENAERRKQAMSKK